MDQSDLLRRIDRLEAELVSLREERIPSVDRSSRRRDRRLTFAYVFVTVTVLSAAGLGSASALEGADTVFSDDIVDGSVRAIDIMDGSVGSVDIRDGSVVGTDVRDGGVASVDVADGTLSSADIADGSVNGIDLNDGTVAGADVADGSLTGADVRDGWITGADIGNDSITNVDILDGNLHGIDIADGGLTGADVNLFDDNRCNGETVQGTALVDAHPDVPATYTTDWLGWTHSCTGQPVRVLRYRTGVYSVTFGSSSPSRLAVATPFHSNVPVTISVDSISAGTFDVALDYFNPHTDAWEPIDRDFTILAY